MAWSLKLTLEPEDRAPVFVQIARSMAGDIQRGRLRPGDRLPGSRSLATTLAVHRNTVLAAYAELLAEGWIQSDGTRGTFVAASLPTQRPRRFAKKLAPEKGLPERTAYRLGKIARPIDPPLPKGALVMAGGVPDVRLVPRAALSRAYRVELRSARLLEYADPQGHPGLRSELAKMLRVERAVAARPEEILVTHGAQQALFLVSELLLEPGDVVGVEAFGYRPAWDALGRRATLLPLPVDAEGLDVDALEARLGQGPIRALYLTPHHQYPTMVTLSASRRLRLLELAERHGFAILEDDYDHEVHYQGRPVLPMASVDRAGVVIYIGTLSKVLAPGLRLGYLVGPRPLIERASALRLMIDRQGDQALEAAVATLFEDDEVQRHARRMRRIYRDRRETVADALRRELAGAVEVTLPPGGMALWLRVDPAIDVDRWAERARAAQVVFAPGRRFRHDGAYAPYMRIGYACLDEAELVEAVKRLRGTLSASANTRASLQKRRMPRRS